MQVKNMTTSNGNKVANQFVIRTVEQGCIVEYLQSYETIIAKKIYDWSGCDVLKTYLDKRAYNYSVTTSKYRNLFLGVTSKDFNPKNYILTILN